MAGDSPAAILFSETGSPIGVLYDGIVYRLQADARITDGYSVVGITDVAGQKALKVDVVKTVGSGGVGSGGTSSNFLDVFPVAGTAVGFTDGYEMQGATVYDLDQSVSTEFVIGTNLRSYGPSGSIETGVVANPLHTAVDGYVQTNPNVNVVNKPGVVIYDGYGNPISVINAALSVINFSTDGNIIAITAVNVDTLLLDANINRRGVFVFNNTTSATLKIGFSSSTITDTNFSVQLSAGGVFEIPFGYTGELRGKWSVNEPTGQALLTELI